MSDTPSSGADAPAATPAVTTPAAPAEVAAPSKGDWAGMAKTQRELHEKVSALTEAVSRLVTGHAAPTAPVAETPPAPAVPTANRDSEAMTEVRELKFRLGLRDALTAAGVHDAKFSSLIEKAARAERPQDLGAFVAEYAGLVAKPAGAQSAPVVPPIAKSDTGPVVSPGGNGSSLPANPLEWPADVVSKLSTEEFHKARQEYARRSGRNPFQHLRKR